MVRRLFAALCAVFAPMTVSAENIVSKADADHIFSLNRPAWEAYAERMIHPDGWKVQRSRHDTGTAVTAFDEKTNTGLSIQPLYHDDVNPPDELIVGSFYPKGTLQPFTPEFKKKLELGAQEDLGSDYSVSASHADVSSWEGIELTVVRANPR